MHIKIQSIDTAKNGISITFHCAVGIGKGFFYGNLPDAGETRVVEIKIPDRLILGKNIRVDNGFVSSAIRLIGESVEIKANVLDVWDRGSASLKIGDDVIMIEYEGNHLGKGEKVIVQPERIELYDANV